MKLCVIQSDVEYVRTALPFYLWVRLRLMLRVHFAQVTASLQRLRGQHTSALLPWVAEAAFAFDLLSASLHSTACEWLRQVCEVVCQHCFDVPSKAVITAVKKQGRVVRVSSAGAAAGYGKNAPQLNNSYDVWVYSAKRLVVRQHLGPGIDHTAFSEMVRVATARDGPETDINHHHSGVCDVLPPQLLSQRELHNAGNAQVQMFPPNAHASSAFAVGPSLCMIQALQSLLLPILRPLARLHPVTFHRFATSAITALLRYLETNLRNVKWLRGVSMTQLVRSNAVWLSGCLVVITVVLVCVCRRALCNCTLTWHI